jgi:heat shock protein 4
MRHAATDTFCPLASAVQKFDEPVLVTADITKKRDMIERVCRPIVSKKPPPPPKPEPAPQPEAAPAAEPMDAETAAEGEEAAKPMEA